MNQENRKAGNGGVIPSEVDGSRRLTSRQPSPSDLRRSAEDILATDFADTGKRVVESEKNGMWSTAVGRFCETPPSRWLNTVVLTVPGFLASKFLPVFCFIR